MRLSDTYYTTNELDGTPTPPLGPGVKEEAPQFYQGDTILLDVLLYFNNQPVLEEEWTITAVLKTSAFADCVTWEGELYNGIYKNDAPGYYRIIIPNDSTAELIAGTYWLDIIITEKTGQQQTYKDVKLILRRQPIMIDYSAGSPNPGRVLDRNELEKTYPPPVDIRRA